jgi:membrane protein DedA with SNARE-associated domain
MHSTIPFLTNFIQIHSILACALLFIGIVLEGEIVMIFGGILGGLGAFNLEALFLTALAGAIVKSLVWYALGKGIAKRYPKSSVFRFLEKKVKFFLPRFRERPFWSIFVSKFIYGINHFALLLSGYMEINFRTYMKAETYSSLPWVAGFLSLGYFFGYTALSISRDIRKFSIIILLFFLAFIFLEHIIAFLFEIRVQSKEDKE